MYVTVDKLASEVSEQTLIQLSNDDYQASAVNVDVVSAAIAYACELIDGYLRSRYVLPLDAPHTILTGLAIDICIYRLYKRRPEGDDIPKIVVDAHANALKVLKAIQNDELHLGIAGAAQDDIAPSGSEFKVSAPVAVDTSGY